VACAPFQPPDAMQLVAPVELQLNVAPFPLMTLVGFVVSETVGANGITVTVALACAVPPAPLHVNV
jgi:hypothetical protein